MKNEVPKKSEVMMKRRKRFKRIMLILLIIGTAFLIAMSPVFELRDIVVTGASKYKADELIAGSGIQKGQNIFRINRSQAEKDMLRAFPYLESIEIKWEYFNRFNFQIKERTAACQVEHMGNYLLTDTSGYMLETRNKAADNLAVIRGLSLKKMELSQKIADENDERLNIAMDVMHTLMKYDLLKQTSLINLEDIQQIHVELRSGILINFRKVDNLDYKVNYATFVLKKLSEDQKGYIDFTRDENPIFTPKANEVPQAQTTATATGTAAAAGTAPSPSTTAVSPASGKNSSGSKGSKPSTSSTTSTSKPAKTKQ